MVLTSTLLLAASCVLPSAMGLTLNTPTGGTSNGPLLVTWTPATGDPAFTILLQGSGANAADSSDVATAINPTLGNTTVNLGDIVPGTYTVQAVNANDIATVLSTSGPFQITNGAAGDNAGGGVAADTTAAAATTAAAVTTAAAATGTAAASTTPANGGPPFDPAGAKNVGNGAGGQFIGGQCLSAADCASGCCAGPSGICSGVGAQTQAGKTGCGFVAGSSSLTTAAAASVAAADTTAAVADTTTAAAADTAAAATGTAAASTTPANGGPPFDPAGAKNVGNGAGGQFIGGQCLSAADCASGCCAGPSGICSGVGAQTQAGKTGCGFVSGQSSLTTAAASVAAGDDAAAATTAAAAAAVTGTAAASTTPANGGPPFDPAGAKNVGNGAGAQFIGGQCLSAADCGSGCCAGPSGICSGVGAQTQAGKTGCGFVSKRFVGRFVSSKGRALLA